ncbi:MAG: sulfatase-like hydrolase/transferase [Candidatus Hydrogenedens sp.]|nr:sulfatase-like hydrolase/transferase [Candidatus Hydrogenedens sp.]
MKWLFSGVLCLLSLSGAAEEARRPNVLVVITDDQGWGDLSSHGNADIRTPVMDGLAAAGARFEHFYVSPVCSPTRASLLTGRYHWRTGVSGVTRGMETMRAEEVTMAEVFGPAGYATGAFGKWHSGAHYPNHPNGQGFAEFTGFCRGHWNNYFSTTLEHDGVDFQSEGYINDYLTDKALAFMQGHAGAPFLCYLAYNTPHSPLQVPDPYFDAAKARGLDDEHAAVYAMCENLDHNLGRLLGWLDEAKLAEDTIVVFLGDNGPNTDRFNGGMRGRKGSVHEGGMRNLLFLRYPRRIPAGTVVPQLAAHIDILPTLADLAGVKLPDPERLDGISLVPYIEGKADGADDRTIYELWGGKRTLRTAQYRWVRESRDPQLYDMHADPGETQDLAEAQPELVEKFTQAYDDFVLPAVDIWTKPPPIPVGYEAAPLVRLDGPEATLNGGLKTFGKHANNSWITDWSNTEDTIAWELEVVKAGDYAVTLQYTCAENNLGARIEASVPGDATTATLTEAHDPGYLPSPDRVPRSEVYERTWASLDLGTLTLPKGDVALTLRATEIPGAIAADVKEVFLKPVSH